MGSKYWMLFALAFALPAASSASGDSSAAAERALAHFLASQGGADGWGASVVEIEASIPKLGQTARLQAIRRLVAPGQVEYQIIALEGDSTVKNQVIARYLSAEIQAAAKPSSTVAITPVNYRFRFAGSVFTGDALSYVFHIAPRKKGDGLIQGELWIDGASGAAVREAGRFVRSPSIFLRRVEVARKTIIQDGAPSSRITRVKIDARFIGRAELTIVERPYTGDEPGAPAQSADAETGHGTPR